MGETITQIGRYEISRQLVETALASVYDAFDPVERKPVAIRIPRTTQTHGTGALALGLKHPNLMTVLSYGENQGATFQVLEPFEGKPLDSDIPEGRKMEPAEALPLLRQLASALDYAHAHGTIHGSLHPSAILRNERSEIKVLDLGPMDLAGRNATAEQLLKAVHYLSPECVRDQPLDGRSDQFSLAVLAHRMLTGELPFPGAAMGVMFRIAFQGLERDSIRELPAPAQIVFQRSLAKAPSERYSTCTEMLEALENALIRKPVAATRLADASAFIPVQAAPIAIVAPKRSRQALKYFGITFVACLLALGGLLYFLLPKAPQPAAQTVPPVVSQPAAPQPHAPLTAPGLTPPGLTPVPPESAPAKPKAAKNHNPAKKKAEPEVEVKPVEPKIIR